MVKPSVDGVLSPRKRRGERSEQQHDQPPRTPTGKGGPATPRRQAGASPSGTAMTPAGKSTSASIPTASAASWQRCCGLLREAVVDPGSDAAQLVPLRPSLRRTKDDLVRLLDEAVSSHNGNASLLVLGPPGTGKTLVVERALQEVCAKHNGPLLPGGPSSTTAAATTAASAGPSTAAVPSAAAADPSAPAPPLSESVTTVGVVRLNGLLQPDERTAFQEAARQLCRCFGQRFVKSATFDENLVFLKGMLHALYKCLKKVIFVVDEFQQYAHRYRGGGKQQMLYYLLDMLQASHDHVPPYTLSYNLQDSKIQAAVIGISSAHNVAEDLEKRVLSRVGRRRVIVTFPAPGPAQDEAAVMGGAGPSSPGGGGGGGSGSGGTAADAAADSYGDVLYDMLALHPGMAALAGLGEAEAEAHNERLRGILREPAVQRAVSKMADIGCPPQHIALAAEAVLAAWGGELSRQALAEVQPLEQAAAGGAGGGGGRVAAAVPLSSKHVLEALRGVVDTPELALTDAVAGLPAAALVMLVAAHRLQRKGQPLCNFEMAWDEYRSIQGQKGAIAFGKEAAAAAWQALPLSGLAHYSDANVESRGRDLAYAGVVLLLGAADLEAGIDRHPHCPDAVRRFFMQEI
ncbi:hypothetical protein HYH03_001134 [Edaphochlamys debaryana]|uniref:Origin recognition complex subunit 4 C-terminal domain-containing protein n=1 Tax=Edaphochlamys debaryana TaxID=47281 RepID=A0A835YGI4_9CHLO|nr:hypothetical protein HYH03_001134 [Edaphochlamys debaryana]|eukprot:KAG2501344.1 hypothetical protein HYH03_001134 [Edaphochlamys debaryana]